MSVRNRTLGGAGFVCAFERAHGHGTESVRLNRDVIERCAVFAGPSWSIGESPMRFEIRISDRSHWSWVLVNETEETIVASRRGFPSRAQASAAAMAFAQLVSRAGRNLAGVPRAGGFL